MAQAALFDMDKTLIRVNSARLFTQFRRDRGEVGSESMLRISWWLLRYWLGTLDPTIVAKAVLKDYRHTKESDMIALCHEWFDGYVKKHITPKARAAVELHRSRGDLLIIASSSTRYAASPLLSELDMHDLVCSELEVENGIFTGEFVNPLCYGTGKLQMVERYLKQHGLQLSEATFYSDSITDLPLLEAVGTAVVVNPDMRLLRQAQKRGWPVESWK